MEVFALDEKKKKVFRKERLRCFVERKLERC